MKTIPTTDQAENIYWTQINTGPWNIVIAATSAGLCYVGSSGQGLAELEAWAGVRLPDCPLRRDDAMLRPYADEVMEYLQGRRKDFSMPKDDRGTPFQKEVWHALEAIPYGHTATYSEIAHAIRKPAAVRAVGTAIGANPLLIVTPCHRVIGKNGTLTGYRGGLAMKSSLLELEGANSTLNRGGIAHA